MRNWRKYKSKKSIVYFSGAELLGYDNNIRTYLLFLENMELTFGIVYSLRFFPPIFAFTYICVCVFVYCGANVTVVTRSLLYGAPFQFLRRRFWWFRYFTQNWIILSFCRFRSNKVFHLSPSMSAIPKPKIVYFMIGI